MSSKNRHNQQHGSTIERSDERIKQTQEVFTPIALIEQMIAEVTTNDKITTIEILINIIPHN